MSRQWVMVFLLVLFILTSQSEWKQQMGTQMEMSSALSQKEQHNSKREDSVKEKIILSQEKNIQKLNDLVRSLRRQLEQCRRGSQAVNDSAVAFTEHLTELERLQFLDD